MKNIFFLICIIIIALLNEVTSEEELSIDNLNENDLEKLIAEYLKDDSESQASKFIPNKVKKNKNIQKEKEEENSPLSSHRRKNGDQTDLVTKNDLLEGKSQQTCSASQFKVEPNVIIDSKASIQKGARLINMEFISKETAQQGLNKLQESCMKQCCESESCDSALLSMRIGVEGYRCYLFECNQNCLYVRHGDYIVLRMKSPEQLDHNKEANVITTGHKDSKTPCHKQYEFTCKYSKKCIPIYDVCNSFDDCDDKSDELNCTTNNNRVDISTRTSSTIKKITTTKLVNKDQLDEAIIEDILKDEISKDQASKDYNNNNNNNNNDNEVEYDSYDLIKQQTELVDYLNQLMNEKKPKNVVHKSPIDFFDSFMRTAPIKASTSSPSVRFRSTTTSVSTRKTTTKYFFHDEINNAGDEKLLENVNPNDKIYFQNKENANTSTGDIIVAIFLLVIGISLVLALFTYLIMSTKYVSKRITWLRKLNMKHKNVDVDPTLEADYLINGMYL